MLHPTLFLSRHISAIYCNVGDHQTSDSPHIGVDVRTFAARREGFACNICAPLAAGAGAAAISVRRCSRAVGVENRGSAACTGALECEVLAVGSWYGHAGGRLQQVGSKGYGWDGLRCLGFGVGCECTYFAPVIVACHWNGAKGRSHCCRPVVVKR